MIVIRFNESLCILWKYLNTEIFVHFTLYLIELIDMLELTKIVLEGNINKK